MSKNNHKNPRNNVKLDCPYLIKRRNKYGRIHYSCRINKVTRDVSVSISKSPNGMAVSCRSKVKCPRCQNYQLQQRRLGNMREDRIVL
jgi:hypothetical protein